MILTCNTSTLLCKKLARKFAEKEIVSQRGVVFFRNQDIGIEDQKILGQKLGELTGKPESSKV
jgi:hypothetical protein